MRLEERLSDVVQPLRQYMAEAMKERDTLLGQSKLLDEEIKKAEKALRYITGDQTKPKPKSKNYDRISRTKMRDMLLWIAAQDGNRWTSADLGERTGFSSGTVSVGLRELREREVIRLIGARPGRGGGKTNVYAAMTDVTDPLINELTERHA